MDACARTTGRDDACGSRGTDDQAARRTADRRRHRPPEATGRAADRASAGITRSCAAGDLAEAVRRSCARAGSAGGRVRPDAHGGALGAGARTVAASGSPAASGCGRTS